MKRIILTVFALLVSSQAAFASSGYANRYVTSYGRWDRAVYETYHYNETTTVSTTCGYYTCYQNVTTTSNVWVEERVIGEGRYRGHHVVHVYRSSGYNDSDRIATYYVSDQGMIYRREFYGDNYGLNRSYYYPGYTVVYTELDAASSAIVVGAYVFVLGAEVIASSPNSTPALVLGGLLMASGSASSAFGSSMAYGEATALQRRIDELKDTNKIASDIK